MVTHSQYEHEKINSCPLWLRFVKEILCLILAVIFLGVVPVSGAQGLEEISPIHLTAHEKKWLSGHPVIRIAPDPYFPPIEFFNSHGEYSGLSADFMQLLQRETGNSGDTVLNQPDPLRLTEFKVNRVIYAD